MPRVVSGAPKRGALVTLEARWTGNLDDYVIALAWSPDGALLAALSVAGSLTLYDARTGALQATAQAHRLGATTLGWSADGRVLASGGQDGCVRLVDSVTLVDRIVRVSPHAWVEKVAWAPADSMLAVAAGRELVFLDATGQVVGRHAGHPSTIADIGWRPGARQLTAACYGGLHHYSPESSERLGSDEWTGSTLAIAWSPDGRFVATGDQDATVHFWFSRTGEDLMMSGYATKVRELAWDPQSRYLATGGSDTVVLWDCIGKGPEGRKPTELNGHSETISALAWQKRGNVLASAGRDGRVLLWRPTQDRRQRARGQFAAPPSVLAWSPDDRSLAVGCDDGSITVLNSI